MSIIKNIIHIFKQNVANIVTFCSLGCGVFVMLNIESISIQLAMLLILIAMFLDGIDGRIARFYEFCNTDVKYKMLGINLDSFCDLINFGVSPLLIYKKTFFQGILTSTHCICLFFYIFAMIFRLARFNIQAIATTNVKTQSSKFSIGLPAPIAALFLLLPISLNGLFSFLDIHCTDCLSIYIVIISYVMLSKTPTPLIKHIQYTNLPKKYKILLLFLFIVLMYGVYTNFIMEIWSLMALIYSLLIIIEIAKYTYLTILSRA